MAYLPFDYSDPQKQQQPATGAAAAGTGAAAGSAAGTPATQDAPDTGSGWVNLQSYLTANQPQAKGLAQQAQNDIAGQVTAAQQGLDQYATDWAARSNAATDAYAAENPQAYFHAPSRFGAKGVQFSVHEPTGTAPTPLAWDPGSSAATDAATRAQELNTGLGTDAGRRAYLSQQHAGQGPYSEGMGGLDAYLMGSQWTPQSTVVTAPTKPGVHGLPYLAPTAEQMGLARPAHDADTQAKIDATAKKNAAATVPDPNSGVFPRRIKAPAWTATAHAPPVPTKSPFGG